MKYFSACILYSFLFLIFLLFPYNLQSANFTQVSLRLDRQTPNTSSTGMVCAQPVTSGTESFVQVTFPAGFTVNANPAVWTVSTTDLPSGATAWPGIGPAGVVSGQSVTFPSSDLTVGTLYCFNFTNSSALTTGSAGNLYSTIASLTAGSSVIDQSQYAVFIHANDQVSLSASIKPNATDAEFFITSVPDSSTILNEGDVETYTLHYKLNLNAGTFPFHIDTNWSRGLIEGTGTYIDAMDYVIGSASNADDGSPAVVDVTNRTISWDIAALGPSAGYHTVTYKLKVHSPLSTNHLVDVTTTVNASLDSVPLAPQTLQNTIQGSNTPTPTPTQTPIVSGTPTLTITPVISPTVTPAPAFEFRDIRLTEITDTQATIQFTTNQPSGFSLSYGSNKKDLTEEVTSSAFSKTHTIPLSNLDADTQYYFRIKAVNKSGKTITSDLFTFRTAKFAENLDLSSSSLNIYANRILISSPQYANIVLPNEGLITIELRFPHPELLEKLTAQFDRKDVLGANSKENNIQEESSFTETLPGILTATVKIPDVLGMYQLAFNLQTHNGTYLTQVAPYTFNVTSPMIVLNAKTHQPIERAHVIIYRYQESYNTYSLISQSIDYKEVTDYSGTIHIILPSGRYKFEAWAVGYPKITQEFELGKNALYYPTFLLKPSFSISSIVVGYTDSIQYNVTDFVLNLSKFERSLASLKSTYTLLGILDCILLLLFIRNQKVLLKKHPSFVEWLMEKIYINVFFIIMIISLLFFLIFSAYQGVRLSLPLLAIAVANFYVLQKTLQHNWEEFTK